MTNSPAPPASGRRQPWWWRTKPHRSAGKRARIARHTGWAARDPLRLPYTACSCSSAVAPEMIQPHGRVTDEDARTAAAADPDSVYRSLKRHKWTNWCAKSSSLVMTAAPRRQPSRSMQCDTVNESTVAADGQHGLHGDAESINNRPWFTLTYSGHIHLHTCMAWDGYDMVRLDSKLGHGRDVMQRAAAPSVHRGKSTKWHVTFDDDDVTQRDVTISTSTITCHTGRLMVTFLSQYGSI